MATVTASNTASGWTLSSSSSRLRNATLPVQLHLHQVQASHIVASANAKQANLSASRIQRVELPVYDDTSKGRQAYHISHFLSHPSGIQAILNTSALQNFQYLDTNAYRCTLPKLAFFNFEATPVLDLRVIPTKEDCTVELFSCKNDAGSRGWTCSFASSAASARLQQLGSSATSKFLMNLATKPLTDLSTINRQKASRTLITVCCIQKMA
ncbi:Protein of unknown function DUF1997 - like 3 [Theobroma cacao]|nr:Protein of unknown function DUF1997 - like 3 [Theobroma cacao]